MFRIRLKELREKAGLSQEAFAKAFGVAQSTVGGWESGARVPRLPMIEKIAEFFNVPTSYFVGGSDEPSNVTPIYTFHETENKSPSKGVKIPVLGRVVAGVPVEAVEEILDYEEINPEIAARGEHFALRIQGDSMEPRMLSGDVVIVRKQSDVDNGDTAVVLVNGNEATIKKIKKSDDGIMLIPTNPNYEVMFYSTEQIKTLPVSIIGKVVELRCKY